jgi:hypothetical protein
MNKNIEDALFELLTHAKENYGDKVEKIWFYDGELCPLCNKHKIDVLVMGKEAALSLNAFMYHDMRTMIGYFLCSSCITDLLGASVQQKNMYNRLEENLKNAYQDHIKSLAS